MSLFSGIGRAIHSPGFGLRLQAALAAASGDQSMLFRIQELQRQNAMRDAQVMGAKNMGFTNDEIGALSAQDLSHLAYGRAAQRMFAPPSAGAAGDDADGMLKKEWTPQPAPMGAPPVPAPPDKAKGPFDPADADASPLGYGAQDPLPPAGDDVATTGKGPTGLPRAGTPDEAAGLPQGCLFFAPNGSIRKKI
jgi:hypothetical protein